MQLVTRTSSEILRQLVAKYPVVTITGPRQSGKTTLCRTTLPERHYVNLESLEQRSFAREDPKGFLRAMPDGGIIDEIQYAPDLVSYIQVLIDERDTTGLFILTGSQQFEVSQSVNQSLAGRTALLRLLPLSLEELGDTPSGLSTDELLLRGFYPRIWKDELEPSIALESYLETYVERDIRNLLAIRNLSLFRRFVQLCAGRVGQLLNFNSIAADTGVSRQTARNWLTLLEASYVVFQLPPYFANISKRLVKSSKLYFYDVGLASALVGIETPRQMLRDPLRGHLFENMVVAEVIKHRFHRGKRSNACFYRDAKGNEVDLVTKCGGELFPMEIKSGMTLNRDYFKGLRKFRSLFPTPHAGGLIYDGDLEQVRERIQVYNYRAVHRLLGSIEELTV